MSSVASKLLMLGCTFTVLVVVIVLHFVDYGPTAGLTRAHDGTRGEDPASSAQPFTIEGNATEPISPGVRAPLDLKLTNPHGVPMSVTDLSVTVEKVSAPNADDAHPCALSDFAADGVSSSRKIAVAARSTSTLSNLGIPRADQPHVGMLNRPVNQDGCKGASLTLAFTASGTLDN
jgi:hypothetical protein